MLIRNNFLRLHNLPFDWRKRSMSGWKLKCFLLIDITEIFSIFSFDLWGTTFRLNCFHPGISIRLWFLVYMTHVTGSSTNMKFNGSILISPFSHSNWTFHVQPCNSEPTLCNRTWIPMILFNVQSISCSLSFSKYRMMSF